MKIPIIFKTIVVIYLMTSFAYGSIDPDYEYKIPEYMKSISDAGGLRDYIYGDKYEDRVTACLRLGEIGGEPALRLLKEAFEKEPYQLGIEAAKGVKFHALASIGKIGRKEAEDYLNSIIDNYAKPTYKSQNHADSIMILMGAYEGLYEIGSKSAIATLEAVYNNKELFWLVRSIADLTVLKHRLRAEQIKTAADTANFLIDQLRPYDEYPKQLDENFKTRDENLKYYNVRFWLYQFRKITLPYLEEYLSELPYDNTKAVDLRKLRESMIANPPSE